MLKDYFKRCIEKLIKWKLQIGLVLLSIFLMYCGYVYYSKFFGIFTNAQRIKKYILSYGKYSVIAFFVMQILQVVAFFIPGEVVQIAGGYIFGTFYGGIISVAGITAGSGAAFFIANKLGKPFVEKLLRSKANGIKKFLKSESANYAIFLIYLIPGLPKDILAYLCGVSEVSGKSFMIYSTLGRLPAIFISAYFGAKFNKDNKVMLIIIAVVMIILFLIGAAKGEKILKRIIKSKN